MNRYEKLITFAEEHQPYDRVGKMSLYFYPKEGCILIFKNVVGEKKVLLLSPEGSYRFLDIKVHSYLIFIGIKGDPTAGYIYSVKKDCFLVNPILKNNFSFRLSFRKVEGEKDRLSIDLRWKSEGHVSKIFDLKTHSFL